MKLIYRGVAYNQPETTVTTESGAVMGQYRGAAWKATVITSPLKPVAAHTLCWRGVVYNTDGSPIQAPASQAEEMVLPLVVKAHDTGLGDAHRHSILKSLEHRMEVARNQGNQDLISILEDEWKQFA